MSVYTTQKETEESKALDASVLAHLKKAKGKRYGNHELASYFNETTQAMRCCVERLYRADLVRVYHDGRRRLFYVPTKEQLQAMEAKPEAPKPMKVYKLPPEMKKMIDGLHEARAKHPSFYPTNTK